MLSEMIVFGGLLGGNFHCSAPVKNRSRILNYAHER